MDPLKNGTRVRILRTNGEALRGQVLNGPVPALAHIGEFYVIGSLDPAPEPPLKRGQKTKARLEWEKQPFPLLGMYSRDRLDVVNTNENERKDENS